MGDGVALRPFEKYVLAMVTATLGVGASRAGVVGSGHTLRGRRA
jgi:hypothetical protein